MPDDNDNKDFRQIIFTYLIVFGAFLLLHPLASLNSILSEIINTGIFAALWLVGRRGIEQSYRRKMKDKSETMSLNSYFAAHGIHGNSLLNDIIIFLVVSFIILVPFYFGYILFFKYLCKTSLSIAVSYRKTFFSAICHQFIRKKWRYRWPKKLYPKYFETILSQYLVVAFPEEYFFRGFMQTGFQRYFSKTRTSDDNSATSAKQRTSLLTRLFNKHNLLTSVLFSIGHLIARFSPMRLFVFFPSLIFGAMRDASNSIWPGVFFHASANVFSDMLHRGYLND